MEIEFPKVIIKSGKKKLELTQKEAIQLRDELVKFFGPVLPWTLTTSDTFTLSDAELVTSSPSFGTPKKRRKYERGIPPSE